MSTEAPEGEPISNAEKVTAQTRRGVFSLLARQAITFPIGFISSIVLARLLIPEDFGTYATLSFLVMASGAFFELGLGSVLIQQDEEPTALELRSVFTVYIAVFGTLAIAVMLLAGPMTAAFHLPEQGAWLLRAMTCHMFMGAIGSIPTFLLERHMRFDVFGRLDVINVLVDKAVTISLAFAGWGAASFVVGSLVSAVLRLTMLVFASPWPWGFAWDRPTIRRGLSQGAYFQGENLLYLVRENGNALLGGTLYGPRAVGYLNWGLNLPFTIAVNFIAIFGRVSFPAFARLQTDVEARAALLADGLRILNLATFPPLALLVVLGDPIVTHVYGEIWRPALPALYCFAARMATLNFVSPVLGYLNATGRVHKGFKISLVWTILEFGIALATMPWLGFYGIAVGALVGILVPAVWMTREVRREHPFPLGQIIGTPLAVAALVAAVGLSVRPYATSLPAVLAALVVAMAVAVGLGAWLERDRLRTIPLPRMSGTP